MKRFQKKWSAAVAGLLLLTTPLYAGVSRFDETPLENESYWGGAGSGETGFESGDFHFPHNASKYSWDGFAYSNTTDVKTAGYLNQFSAATGRGVDGSANYGLAFDMGWVRASLKDGEDPRVISGLYATNTTYAYLSMKEGDSFAKKFGGEDGTDPDWFSMDIRGVNAEGGKTDPVRFYLADFQSDDSEKDYILNSWKWVDLSSLGKVTALEFKLNSSDVGSYGMNTPAYFALDNLGEFGFEGVGLESGSHWNGSDGRTEIHDQGIAYLVDYNKDYGSWSGFAISTHKDTETPGFENQYSAVTGGGAAESATYAVGFTGSSGSVMQLSAPAVIPGAYVTNSTYAYLSMKEGDAYAKKFGGETGLDKDWFKLTATGLDADGKETGAIDFFLADYRSEVASGDYIVKSWKWIDLSKLGSVSSVRFTHSSTDNGAYGMNTPAYFCLDHVGADGSDDLNKDGIPDKLNVGEETDLDADGKPDAAQGGIVAVRTADGTKLMALSKGDEAKIHKIKSLVAVAPESLGEEAQAEKPELPFGLVDFSLDVEAGAEVRVSLYLSQAAPKDAKWYKYDARTGWKIYDNAVFSQLEDGRTKVVISLTDGGEGDADGEVNGVIQDPGGVGYIPEEEIEPSCFIESTGMGRIHLGCGVALLLGFAGFVLVVTGIKRV